MEMLVIRAGVLQEAVEGRGIEVTHYRTEHYILSIRGEVVGADVVRLTPVVWVIGATVLPITRARDGEVRAEGRSGAGERSEDAEACGGNHGELDAGLNSNDGGHRAAPPHRISRIRISM